MGVTGDIGGAAGSVEQVLAQIAVIPSAPLLVPEIAGPEAVETEPVRAAAVAAGRALAAVTTRWVALGVADSRGGDSPRTCAPSGDFGGYGVPLPVSLPGLSDDPRPQGSGAPPLSMLLAGWLAAQVWPHPARVQPLIVDPAATPAQCAELGRQAAASSSYLGGDEPIGLLVVADGANALSDRAPGGGDRASAWAVQRRIDAALAAADPAGLRSLSTAECLAEGVGTRAAWQALAGVLEAVPARGDAEVTYAAAPLGVGYTVATLRPQDRR